MPSCPPPHAHSAAGAARLAALGLSLCLAWNVPARAQPAAPACDALAGWIRDEKPGETWEPGAFSTRFRLPAIVAAPATASLFGRPLTRLTEAEARDILAAIAACQRDPAMDRRKNREGTDRLRRAAQILTTQVIPYAAARDKGLAESTQAMAVLERQPPTLPLLRFYAALARLAPGPQAMTVLAQAQQGLPMEAAVAARALVGAIRDSTPEDYDAQVRAPAAARVEALRGPVRDRTLAEVAAMPATPDSLQAMAQAPERLRAQFGPALGREALAAIETAMAARRAALAREVADAAIARLAAVPVEADALRSLDTLVDARLLALLPGPEAARVRQATEARRAALGEALLAQLQARLAAMPARDESLREIDTLLARDLQAWPASSRETGQRLAEAARARRAVILAEVNRREAGPLRGRRYATARPSMKLEFVDATRVFVTGPDGQTIATTYGEEADGRITLVTPQGTQVLTRDGRALVSGPVVFQRTDSR
ncbi:hypothetical protein LPC08_09220 [Roseomonas sp. OT10]|uniref:hypothetical protein n=1 Tax=Roseomonas cutis TaxID=2897332 RepID=UPI001E41486F|nr:hypothetical protein [Roseomonas sp. OT10]UFN50770.1 hypothetical protein LPC08_09220 [Roseomonas sp. OT10]